MNNNKAFLKNFAIIVVVVGVLGLLGKYQETREKRELNLPEEVNVSKESEFEMNNVMSGNKKEIDSQDFKSGEINCLMAGAEVDFRKANINGIAKLDANAMMGAVKVLVPKDWTVKLNVTAIMGAAHDNKEDADVHNPNKTLIIDGSVLMGSVEVKRF